jgi:hypothetical protein
MEPVTDVAAALWASILADARRRSLFLSTKQPA